MDFEENTGYVRERIASACRRAGRRPEEVKLVAVSKTVPPELIRRAFEAGLHDFGENRVQEANAKRPALSDLTVTWHMVGHLQSNKRSEEHTSELQSRLHLVCRLLLEKKKKNKIRYPF